MRVINLSREVAEMLNTSQKLRKFYDIGSYVMISITDPESSLAKVDAVQDCVDILRLQFHDVDRDMNNPVIKMFQPSQAKEILQFVSKWSDSVGLFVVHCEAGISRSAGVAAALTKCCGDNDSEFFQRFHPNRYVYSMILAMHHRLI